jgi:iron complex outermembrane receptor protein
MNHTLRLRSILAFGVSAVALIGAAPAFAAAAAPAAPAAPAADEGVNQVIVTAEKREVSLQKVPVAVSAFTAKQRDLVGIENLQDMTNFTPGLVYSSVLDHVTLRGIGRLSTTLAAEGGVATYVDGFFTTSAVEAAKPPLFIDRVEVERGPQGTLFGRNSIGGAINVITKHPTDDFYAEGRVDVGNYGYVDLEGVVSGPVADGLDLRLSGFQTWQTQGYFNNVAGGRSEGNVLNEYYIEPQFEAKRDNWDWFVKAFAAGWNNVGGGGPGARSAYTTGPYDYNETSTGISPLFFNAAYGYTAAGAVPFVSQSLGKLPAFNLVEVGHATTNPSLTNIRNFNDDTTQSVKLKNSYDVDTTFTWHAPGFDIKYTGGYQTYNYNLISDSDNTSITSFQIPLNPGSACGKVPLVLFGCQPLTVFPHEVTSYQEFNHWFSHEITFASTNTGPLQWIGGLYYYDENYSNPVSVSAPNQPQVAAPIAAPTFALGSGAPNPNHYLFYSNYIMETRSEAAYGQLDWKVTSQIKVTGGLRFTTDHKDGNEYTRLVSFMNGAFGTAENLGIFLPAADVTSFVASTNNNAKGVTSPLLFLSNGIATRGLGGDSDAVTGTAGIEWTPTDQTLGYFRYSRGYKAFALNAGSIAPNPEAGPEYDNDFELGWKQTFGRTLTIDAALYYNDYEDAQIPISVALPPTAQLVSEFFNIPKARSDGFEFDGNWSPIDHLQLSLDYSLNDTAILSGCSLVGGLPTGTCLVNTLDSAAHLVGAHPVGTTGVQSVAGNPLPQAPRNKIGFNANYTFVFNPGSLTLSGSYIWRDVQYGDIFKTPYSSAPHWDQVDIRATWKSSDDRYEFVGYMRNVFNTVGYEAAASGINESYGVQNLYGINPPRTFGVQLIVRTR